LNFFDSIRSWFIWATNVLVGAALDCYSSFLPLDWLGDALGDLSDFTSMVAGYLWDASNWYEDAVDLIREILTWQTIRGFIRSWLDGIETAIAWFSDWWFEVGQRIDSWWADTWSTVQDAIDLATRGLEDLEAEWDNFWEVTFPDILDDIAGLKSEWDSFWTVTFPTLVSFSWLGIWWSSRVQEVQNLIDSAFTIRESLWTGWQDMRDQVIDFFTDPLEWLWGRFTDWFLGPE